MPWLQSMAYYAPPPPPPPPTAEDWLARARKDNSPDLAQAHALIAIAMLLAKIEQHLGQGNMQGWKDDATTSADVCAACGLARSIHQPH